MSDIKITLDKNVNWDSSALGVFDGSSSLAQEIDADEDGVITKLEFESYQKSHKNYSVIDKAEAPKNFDELSDLMKKAEESYSGMEQEAEKIAEDNASFVSQLNTLIAGADSDTVLKQAKANVNNIEQLSKDYDTTANSVKKVLEEAKKQGFQSVLFGDLIINNVSGKINEQSDEVKKHIETVHTNVDDTEKTVESKLKKDTPEEKTTKTKNV